MDAKLANFEDRLNDLEDTVYLVEPGPEVEAKEEEESN
jgi:hypothetical protein